MPLKEFIQRCLEQHSTSLVQSLDGLTPQELAWCPDPQCMSIGFIVWHMSRAEDFLIQSLIKGAPQLWETGWAERFHRAPANPMDNGFGFTAEQVAAFQLPAASELLAYAEATRTNAVAYLQSVDDATLEQVTVASPFGGRLTLASVYQQFIWEVNQHGGQIAYLRGMQRGIENPMQIGSVFEGAQQAS
jgi:uncharacterized damage-inducible protein DinB